MVRNAKTTSVVIIAVCGMLFVAGCSSNAQTGTGFGALLGAGVGQLIGGDTEATLIGAAIGGGAGYMFGNEADKSQARAEREAIRKDMQYVSVNVTNSNGSISQVNLRRHGIGYYGTRGEFYDHLPTEDELRPVYGF